MASLPCNARECSPSEGMRGAGRWVILIYTGANLWVWARLVACGSFPTMVIGVGAGSRKTGG